jgi:putative ABC transport system ATP-binding protein
MTKEFPVKICTIELRNLSKDYMLGTTPVKALSSIDLTINEREFVVITGPSGSGKSTLLNMIGCIDLPDEGTIDVAGQNVIAMNDRNLTSFRSNTIGFIFQTFNLLPVLTALENVEFPLQLCEDDQVKRTKIATDALIAVGLKDFLHRRPSELSGGQRQRVAIARALVKKPAIIVADEPTANLDSATGAEIISLMRDMQKTYNTTFIFSSHDPQLIKSADRVITLVDGVITDNQSSTQSISAVG